MLFVLLAGVVTALLSAPLLPAIAATAIDSGRAAGLSADEVFKWSLSPVRLLELPLGPLIPIELIDFHGPLLSAPLGGHTGALWVASEFVGVTVLSLAPVGLMSGPLPSARRYALLAGVGLLLSLGSAGLLYPLLLKTVPGWSAFRYPEKMMPLAVLGLALLAARGAGLAAGRAHRRSALLLGVLMLPFAVALEPGAVTWAFEKLGASVPDGLAESIADGLRARASAGLLVCVALAFTAWRRPVALAWVAVVTVSLQAAWCARGLIETRPRTDLALTPSLLDSVLQAGGARTRLAAWPEHYNYSGEHFAATAAARRGDFEALAPSRPSLTSSHSCSSARASSDRETDARSRSVCSGPTVASPTPCALAESTGWEPVPGSSSPAVGHESRSRFGAAPLLCASIDAIYVPVGATSSSSIRPPTRSPTPSHCGWPSRSSSASGRPAPARPVSRCPRCSVQRAGDILAT